MRDPSKMIKGMRLNRSAIAVFGNVCFNLLLNFILIFFSFVFCFFKFAKKKAVLYPLLNSLKYGSCGFVILKVWVWRPILEYQQL